MESATPLPPQAESERSFLERIIVGAITLGEVNTPTVVVINALLSVGVLILSSTLAVLHLASEVRLWDQPRQEGAEFSIQTHVLVLLLLTVGLLVSFNWFIGAYREKQELDTDEGEDENTGRSERRSDPAGQGLAEHRDERLVKKTR